jgi:serine/threonine protein kinase
MHFILEYADSTLFEMKDKLDLLQFKSVLFQILYALYIAQTELEFNHNDLHLKNILLKWVPNGEFAEFKDYDGTCWYTNSYTVKICDFGISRFAHLVFIQNVTA